MGLLEIRFLVPSIIFITFLADASLRFVPPERIAFRAWEAVGLFSTAEGPFAPNMVYHNDRSYGDLANMGNAPSRRVYRQEHFTTDAFGFRNTPTAESRPTKIITVGDSFAAGSALSDSETLSSQLADMTQSGVCNSGGNNYWPRVEKLIKRLHFHGGLVIWQISERSEVADFEDGTGLETKIRRSMASMNSPFCNRLWRILLATKHYAPYSPLQIFATRLFQNIQDDRWLPNVSASRVSWRRLDNGQEIGFLSSEVANFDKIRNTNPDFFVQLQADVRATGNELLVLLVPDKYNVYYPLLTDSSDRAAKESQTLGLLAQHLHANGVPVLNLTPEFRQQAAVALQNNQYIYWADDTHWNHLGVKIAAREILKFLREK